MSTVSAFIRAMTFLNMYGWSTLMQGSQSKSMLKPLAGISQTTSATSNLKVQQVSTENSHDIWWTPRDLVAVLDREFHFDLDAAVSSDNAICERYITEEQDALITPWNGHVVWCNPPYGRGH